MRSRVVSTRLSPKIRLEFMKLAYDLGTDESGLLRVVVKATLVTQGRISREEAFEERDTEEAEDDDQ